MIEKVKLGWLKDIRRISISLTIIAALLYTYSLTQARFEIGYFGFIHSLPPSFFVALALLTVASAILWVSPQPHGKLLGLQLGLLIVALHLTPLAVAGIGGAQAGAGSLYSEFGLGEYVFRTGHFSPTPSELWRLYWPGGIILNAAIMLVSGIDDASSVLILNIFLWIFLITPLVYLFLRTTVGKDRVNYCLAGVWLFFVANWILYYLMPSIVGYLLLLLIMGLLAKSLLQGRQGFSFPEQLCLILALVVLPATHLLTALVALAVLLVLFFIRRVRVLGLAMLLFVVIASWSMYVTGTFMEWHLPLFVEQLKTAFRLDVIWNLGVAGRMVGSEAHQTANTLRVSFAALFFVIGAAGGIMALKDKENTNGDKFVLATVIGIFAMLLVISKAYYHELIQRAYFFVVPAIAYFGVKLLKHKTTAIILTILLVVALPLRFVALYGNAVIDYISPEEIAATYFFEEHASHGTFTGSFVLFPLGFTENREDHRFVYLEQLLWEDNALKNPPKRYSIYPHYLYLRQVDQEIYDFIGYANEIGINEYGKSMLSQVSQHIDSVTNYNMIYAISALSMYLAEGP